MQEVKLDQKYKNSIEENEKMISQSVAQAKLKKQEKAEKVMQKKKKVIDQGVFDCMDEFLEGQKKTEEVAV